jgi:hypothetical protein
MRKLILGVVLITGSALLASGGIVAKHKAAKGPTDCKVCHETLKIAKKKGFDKATLSTMAECKTCHAAKAAPKK